MFANLLQAAELEIERLKRLAAFENKRWKRVCEDHTKERARRQELETFIKTLADDEDAPAWIRLAAEARLDR